MKVDKIGQAEKLLMYLGEIDDVLIEEAELVTSASHKVVRKRIVHFGAFLAVAYFLLKRRRGRRVGAGRVRRGKKRTSVALA